MNQTLVTGTSSSGVYSTTIASMSDSTLVWEETFNELTVEKCDSNFVLKDAEGLYIGHGGGRNFARHETITESDYIEFTDDGYIHLIAANRCVFPYMSSDYSITFRAYVRDSNVAVGYTDIFKKQTGGGEIPGTVVVTTADPASEAGAVYYNLQGVRTPSGTHTPGIYIRQCGKNVNKVVIR